MMTPNLTYTTTPWFRTFQLRPSTAFPQLTEEPKTLPMSMLKSRQLMFNEYANSGSFANLFIQPWAGPKLFTPRIIVGASTSSSPQKDYLGMTTYSSPQKEELCTQSRVNITSLASFSDLIEIYSQNNQSERANKHLDSQIIQGTMSSEDEEMDPEMNPEVQNPRQHVAESQPPKDMRSIEGSKDNNFHQIYRLQYEDSY